MTSNYIPFISCMSLGMVIIDEIHMPNRPVLTDVLGGSASFVALGQRLFKDNSTDVGCLVIVGDDFPPAVNEQIESWGTTLVKYTREGKRSTRGRLVYKDDTFGPKTFEYTGDAVRATPVDLIGTPLLRSKAFHFFGTPKEILRQVPDLIRLRGREGIQEHPFIVWEPLPAVCTTNNQTSFLEACKLVDVFSPNHLELAAIFEATPIIEFDDVKIESYGKAILESMGGAAGDGVVIVRAAEHGALSMSRKTRPTWLPSYYEYGSLDVVDPTGAGNTFLGGYIAGWQKTSDVHEAVYYGHVAASFALEQIGLPKLGKCDGKVLCSGVVVLDRLEEYRKKLGEAEIKSDRVL